MNSNQQSTGKNIEVIVQGMTCSGCALTVEKAIKSIKEVKEAKVDLSTGRVFISVDCENKTNLARKILDKVDEKGYKVITDKLLVLTDVYSIQEGNLEFLKNVNGITSVRLSKALDEIEIDFIKSIISDKEIVRELKKLGVKVNGLISSATAEARLSEGDRDLFVKLAIASPIAGIFVVDMLAHLHLFKNGWLQFALATPVVIFSASEFTKGLLRKFAKLSFDMNVLVSLGVLTAYIFSTVDLAFLSSGNLYYESSVVITTVVLIGRFIESKIKSNTASAFLKLKEIEPKIATVLRGDREIRVEAGELKSGDVVVLHEGERIPADGVIQDGEIVIDESHITGEILHIKKSKGDYIFAGSLILSGWGIMLVKEAGEKTVLHNLIFTFREAQLKKSRIERLTDKISAVFIPIIMIISSGTFLFWAYIYSISFAIERAISVLVVACPCALGLATPLAVVSAVSRFLKRGVIIKNPTVFEIIPYVQTVAFDKTGTLTEGNFKITCVYVYKNGRKIIFDRLSDEEKRNIKTILASAEISSEHKIAKAILEFSKDCEIRTPDNYFSLRGRGIFANVNGTECIIGNERIFSEFNVELPDFSNEISENKDATYIFFSINKETFGIIFLQDKVKEGVEDVIKFLKSQGRKIVIITGDKKDISERIGKRLGVDRVFSEALPDEKVKIIESLKGNTNKVMMVGDGINDSPSILLADVGVAVQSASEISKVSSDIVIQDVKSLKELFLVSKFVLSIIKQNLLWAFIYNILLIPVASGVFVKLGITLNPMLSSIAMSLSSISVVLNSLRILKK